MLAIIAVGRSDTPYIEEIGPGETVAIIVNQTPFYGESGGQQGDTGSMFTAGGGEFQVNDTQKKLGDVIVHFGEVSHGLIKRGDAVEMRVDGDRRTALRAHHSATHLLHEALRRHLGDHVTQKGSLVAPGRLRFDISHNKPLSPADIAAVEAEVNARIRDNAPVTTRYMTPEEAVEAGALALFGEKYGDEVRVVSMGGGEPAFSTELCGGIHVARAGDIGFLKITGESALAAGVRRIEAVVGAAALAHVRGQEAALSGAAAALKTSPAQLAERVGALVEDRRKLEREVSELRRKLAAGGGAAQGGAPGAKDVAGVKFAARVVADLPAKDLKPMADDLKKQLGSAVIALVAVNEGRASLVVAVTEDLTDRFNAVDLVRLGSAALGGKGGGGRPDMAQAGGPDGAAADKALAAIEAAMN